ncbi:MAG: PAS domain-containing sensor histidine kinase [Eubacterium sp.]|nr:PAS domain-containing sensor histidine kinase [Eubacterium sp.]
MTKKIFRSICLVAMIVFLSSVVLIMGVLYDYFSDLMLAQLKMQTNLISHGVSKEGIRFFDGLDDEHYRITWMDAAGTILYDSQSDYTAMENHLEREEIRQALEEGYGESDRYSATLMERSFYSARRLDDGSIVRLCTTHGTILILLLGMSQPVFLVFAIAVILSVVLAARLSGNIVKPFNTLDLDNPLDSEHYEELTPLLRRIGSQQSQLKLKEAQLQQKQEELHAVISNMKEGMILLSADGKILSINPAAAMLLNPSQQTPSVLIQAADSALLGNPQEQIVTLNNRHYQITASPVISEGAVSGAALLLLDVTEKEKAEQMRREFTANVSHELKTPLHAISGYAELLKNGMVKASDICPFAEKIYAEAQRMAKLVEDIINLSHLDEGAGDMQFEAQDLFAAAASAVRSLAPEADDAEVTVSLLGDAAVIPAVPQLLYGIVCNLCDNAIKYSRKGGSVFIQIQDEPGQASLIVRDTGIGIPPEHQEHIFERFYRVDKSHSKQLGGTGLGLSIVKHAAIIHHAKLTLHSVLDEGTTVTVVFPKQK